MALAFSETAARHVLDCLQNRGRGLGIRLVVVTSECSGMAYRLVFVDEIEENDVVFDSHGAKIYVDTKSLVFLDGAEIDYAEEGDQAGFSVRNPNARSVCDCGDSFAV
ncbi:HesB/IscA family protein [Propionivibrio limicola]|uniref:HesB/IscA family protein n=1 Tax=Propionivibrio limicola TaxID=167645 RepID=UPI0012923DDC|nr:iron-sulfur cluster assembly accessory protein [Propionivibrio limicola]